MNDNFSIRHISYASHVPIMELNDTIPYHDITICISGKMEYCIDGQPVLLTQGDCIYIAPGSHRVRAGSSSGTTYLSINLNGELNDPISSMVFPKYLTSANMPVVDLLRDAYTTRNADKMLLLSKYLLCDLQERYRSNRENPVVLQIKQYIQQNIHARLSVEEISRQVYLSKEYCQSLFKQHTGVSIVTFINREKVNASKMLLTGEHDLTTISQMLGFEDYNYFCRVFKKYAGISPLKYRRFLQNDGR